MKIKATIDLIEFFNTINCCIGSVKYQFLEGGELNLKSILSQYIVAMAFHSKDLLVNGNIICSNKKDIPRLRAFLID